MRMEIPLKMVSAVCFAACAVLGARAEEYHVYSELKDGLTGNQQLTNAFAKAIRQLWRNLFVPICAS